MINPTETKPLPTQPHAEPPTSREEKIQLLTKLFGYFRGSNQQQQTIKKLHYTNQAFRIVFRNRLQLRPVPPRAKKRGSINKRMRKIRDAHTNPK